MRQYLELHLPSQAHVQHTCQTSTAGPSIKLSASIVLAKSASTSN